MAKSKTTAKSTRTKTAAKKTAPSRSAKTAKAKPAAKKSSRKPAAKKQADEEVKLDRRRTSRRKAETAEKAQSKATESKAAAPKAEKQPKLERRQKTNRRRQIDPTTCERDYTGGEVEFMNALDEYKRTSGRMFPTCSEVLEVIRDLGYVQLSPAELATVKAGRGEVDEPAAEPSPEDTAEADALEALEESASLRDE